MALVTIIYNASSGSDTAASGSNAPTTAVTGTNGDIATTTLTLNETKDFTGVANDGSDVLWYEGNAGDRHLFRITGFTGGVSTCTALTLAETATASRTAKNWAVGGIRQTLKNDTTRLDTADALAGWRYELQAGTYAMTTSVITFATATTVADGPIELAAAAGASPTITWTSDARLISVTVANVWLVIDGLTLTNTTSTSILATAVHSTSNAIINLLNCTIDCYYYGVYASGSPSYWAIRGCDITSTNQDGINFETTGEMLVTGCVLHGCGQAGIYVHGSSGTRNIVIVSNVIRDNNIGIEVNGWDRDTKLFVQNNVIHANTGNGFEIQETAVISTRPFFYCANNLITSNGAYGISFTTSTALPVNYFIDHNAYRSNTSGEVNNCNNGANDVTLTADPYTNEAGDDYSLNATAGGGAACKDAGYGRTS